MRFDEEKGWSDFDQYRTSTRVEARQALVLAACGVEIAGIEPALEGLFERRPFAVEDREPAGVAVAALVDSGLAEEALVAKAEAQCCGARWRVERVAFPLVTPVAQFVEDTAHHQVHRLGGGWCALQERRKIDAADFDDAGRGIDAHIAGDADGAADLALDDAMNKRIVAGGCSLQVLEVLFEPGVWPMGQIGPVAAFLVELVGGVEIGGVASGVDRLDPAIASFHGAAAWARRPIWQRKPDRLPQLIEMFGHCPLPFI